jgi:hypothetical protein
MNQVQINIYAALAQRWEEAKDGIYLRDAMFYSEGDADVTRSWENERVLLPSSRRESRAAGPRSKACCFCGDESIRC